MHRLLTLIACLTLASTAAAQERRGYSATAYALEGGEKLYVEKHLETWRNGRLAEREVRYVEPDGELIARKVVLYGDRIAAPSFDMVDLRNGVREGAQVRDEKVLLYSGPLSETPRPKTLHRPREAVIDAGFDAFMRENFSFLTGGESLEFEFAVPALRRFIRFELVPEGRLAYDGAPALAVTMRPALALVRLLVDPIRLTYSLEGRLLEFRGLANVLDEKGDRYEARIVFDYSAPGPGGERVGAAR